MTRHPDLPTDEQAATLNADFLAGRTPETGWWDDRGHPTPWPDDLDDWRPSTSETPTHPAGEQHY